MKAGLTTSLFLHGALLAFGLVTVSAPKPFDVVEDSIPVTTISESELAQLVAGDRKAPAGEKPAPKPTTEKTQVPDAQNAGENTVDLNNVPTPKPKPREIETASVPNPAPEPVPTPVVRPEPAPQQKVEPAPVPATEVTPKPQPKQEVKPDPVKEATDSQPAEAETSIRLPDTAPLPQRRPQPPAPAQTAKAPDRKDSDKPPEKPKPAANNDELAALEDEVKALINREKPSGGGAKKQEQEAALGAKTTNAPKLSASELGALRDQLGGCWSIDAGIEDPSKLKVSVTFNLDRDGRLDGIPRVSKSSGNPQFDRTAVRAIQKCDVQGLNVPAGKYETWKEVVVNFDPADMFY